MSKKRKRTKKRSNAYYALRELEREGEILWDPVYGEFHSQPEEPYVTFAARPFRVHAKIDDVAGQTVRLIRVENAATPTEARRRTTEFLETHLSNQRFAITLVASDKQYWYDLVRSRTKNDS